MKKMTFPLTKEERLTLTAYDKIAPRWDKVSQHRRWKDARWQSFLKGLPTHATILDLGCGTATQTAELVISEGFQYFGIDLSEKMTAVARKNLEKRYGITDERIFCMDMRQLEFESQAFDGFISVTSFMHLPRETLPAALSEARRVLKPGGRGLISLCWGDFEGMYRSEESEMATYVVCWQNNELCDLFTKAGFSVCLAEKLAYMLFYVIQASP